MKLKDVDKILEFDAKFQEEKLLREKKEIYKKALLIKNVNVIAIFSILLLGFFYFCFAPKTTYSENERRDINMRKVTIKTADGEHNVDLTGPTWQMFFSGDFANAVTKYFSDSVPNRTVFLNRSADLRGLLGIRLGGVSIKNVSPVKPGDNVSVTEKDRTEPEIVIPTKPITTVPTDITDSTHPTTTSPTEITTQATVATEYVDPNEENGDLDKGEIKNGIMVYKNRGIMLFSGNLAACRNYASYLNSFKADLGNDINVYSLVAPTPQTFYLPKKYATNYGSEPDNLTEIRNNLNGVIDINPVPILTEHKSEDIYYRTDHHWSALGAYYSASVFAEKAKVPFPSLNEYQQKTADGFVGTLYGYTQNPDLKNNPETFSWFIPPNYDQISTIYFHRDGSPFPLGDKLIWNTNVANAYIKFGGGDEKINDVRNSSMNTGRVLAIFGDSYKNPVQVFLANSFDRVITLDVRYFDMNAIQYLKANGVTDVLFCMNTFSALGANGACIDKIRTRLTS